MSEEPVAARKAALREHIRKLRSRQPPGLARARSLEAQQRLIEAACWRNAHSVALYVALKGELSTDKLLDAAWKSGRTVWLPRVRPGEAGIMDFVACTGPEQLRTGPFGLREPEDGLPGFGPVTMFIFQERSIRPGMLHINGWMKLWTEVRSFHLI